MMKSWIASCVCILVAACGSSSTSNIDGGPNNPDGQVLQTGTATLSGAQTGSASVSIAALKVDNQANSTVAMAGLSPLPNNVKSIMVSVSFVGAPAVKTYTSTDLMPAAITITTNDNKTYQAGSGYGTIGNLVVSSESAVNHDPATMATAYRLGGSFSATAVNLTSPTDMVMLSVTF
jgi:hypothetical protein